MDNNNRQVANSFYAKFGKRGLDILVSGLFLLVFGPVLLLLMLLVRVKNGAPVFFCPARPGRNEKVFRIIKFRTMTSSKQEDGMLLPEAQRITGLGRFLRASSLDELPELINILKGDMSFVGPRPLAMKYLPYYLDDERLRHAVRPGLTGLAQISGRNNLIWDKRIEKDLEYIENLSFKNDLSILFRTFKKVASSSDIEVTGASTHYQFDTYRVVEAKNSIPTRDEIGDEFQWEETDRLYCAPGENQLEEHLSKRVEDAAYTLSGRAAIDLAIADAAGSGRIRRALVPSYCSFPMLQPFIMRGIPYDFYDVTIESGRVSYHFGKRKNYDLLLYMPYFGIPADEGALEAFRNQGVRIIADVTHHLLADAWPLQADYYTASLRKWFAVPAGGWIGKSRGNLAEKPTEDSETAVAPRWEAMQEKAAFLRGETDERRTYLEKFVQFESELVQLKTNLRLDARSQQRLSCLDLKRIIEKRKENAQRLWEGLEGIGGPVPLVTEEILRDRPLLLFPLLVPKEEREALRLFLNQQGIICHVTWPERLGAPEGIRREELSLCCDQRYGPADMERTAAAVRQFFGQKKTLSMQGKDES